jgi:hypothetical protein
VRHGLLTWQHGHAPRLPPPAPSTDRNVLGHPTPPQNVLSSNYHEVPWGSLGSNQGVHGRQWMASHAPLPTSSPINGDEQNSDARDARQERWQNTKASHPLKNCLPLEGLSCSLKNSQVPPVARLGYPFSFVFSPSTFTSTSPITYSLDNAPKWLSIDSDARRLFGTPAPDDVAPGHVVGVPLNLVASDDSGSTTSEATLVVSRSPVPSVEIAFGEQAPAVGIFSGPSTILASPGEDFSFQLDPKTCSNPHDAPISYYAIMADNTPLPA